MQIIGTATCLHPFHPILFAGDELHARTVLRPTWAAGNAASNCDGGEGRTQVRSRKTQVQRLGTSLPRRLDRARASPSLSMPEVSD
ncbi:hypothetical protein SMAC4_13233 [Sordaria macrospora]|uniref:uncharacterized protein n=1 Tax=Sordaria macrospora TaxID=5147 RepID=UPI002B310CAA|nr:hypothetical protein SMAC4_13233 [Sordaria macrospora]